MSDRKKEVLSIISFIAFSIISAMVFVYVLAHGCSWDC